jgi:hypothetical protein
MDELELEVTSVSEGLSKQFVAEVSKITNLPEDVCRTLLKSGWSLEVDLDHPARWVQNIPKLVGVKL